MFEGTFVLGDYPMQGIEWLVGELGDLIRNKMSEGPLKDLLVDGIIEVWAVSLFSCQYSVALFLYFLDGRLGLYGCCFHYG